MELVFYILIIYTIYLDILICRCETVYYFRVELLKNEPKTFYKLVSFSEMVFKFWKPLNKEWTYDNKIQHRR